MIDLEATFIKTVEGILLVRDYSFHTPRPATDVEISLLSEVSALRGRVGELEGALQEARQALNAAFFDGKAYAGNKAMQRALLDVIEKNKKALAPGEEKA